MPYSKVKNLLILLLALVNVLLLCLVVPLRSERLRQQALETQQLETLFSRNDVRLAVEELPDYRELYTLEFSPDPEAGLGAVTALLGENVLAQAESTPYLSFYTSELGRCQLSRGGNLEARLTGRAGGDGMEADAAALLEQMGFRAWEISAPERQSAGLYRITALQELLHVPVFSSALHLTYRSGALVRLEGTAYFDTASLYRTDDVTCIACADALVAFLESRNALGWVGSEVTGVTQGYFHAETASAAVVRLVPGWRVSTDTGAFWINGVSREVSALE